VTGKGIDQLLGAAFEVREIWSKRVSTGQLNRWFEEAVERNPPPAPGGKRIKLRYITQVNTRPPSFVLFGTRVTSCRQLYPYLINGNRKELGFARCRYGSMSAPRAIRSTRTSEPPSSGTWRLISAITDEESPLPGNNRPVLKRAVYPDRLVSGACRTIGREKDGTMAEANPVVDWSVFQQTRAELGPGFVRILGYFQEDGEKSVAKIEDAMRARMRPLW
jgi:hypothetical protein